MTVLVTNSGVCKYVPLQQPAEGSDQWTIDISQVEAAISPRTKVIVLNNPHNPTGKVFTREELLALAAVVERHPDLTVVTDEVYEHVVFDGREHVRFATLPNMWDRTLTVSSAGKTFSVTGWKVGWLIGPQRLVNGVMLANQWVQFSVPTPLQEAVAEMLVKADEPYQGHATYYDYVRATYKAKRDALVEALTSAGMHAYVPEGGIFVMANTSAVCRWQ
jgi:kynurenine--oxoglutarate transaminase/cysteine-S-conjugate beta-lyase/glutamine--phenylpyruvate transaminase